MAQGLGPLGEDQSSFPRTTLGGSPPTPDPWKDSMPSPGLRGGVFLVENLKIFQVMNPQHLRTLHM